MWLYLRYQTIVDGTHRAALDRWAVVDVCGLHGSTGSGLVAANRHLNDGIRDRSIDLPSGPTRSERVSEPYHPRFECVVSHTVVNVMGFSHGMDGMVSEEVAFEQYKSGLSGRCFDYVSVTEEAA